MRPPPSGGGRISVSRYPPRVTSTQERARDGAVAYGEAFTAERAHMSEQTIRPPATSLDDVFTRAYRTHAVGLRGFISTIILDPHLAEDVVHEAFIELWQHPDRFDPTRADLQSWLRTIAHRRAIDRIRSLEASRARDLRFGTRDVATSNHDPDQWDTLFSRPLLHAALARLTERQRTAVSLRYLGERTTIELADTLQVSVGTAKTRVRDALLLLRQHLAAAPE